MKTKLEEAAEALKDSIENFDDWTTGEVRDLALSSLEGGYNVAKLESNQAIQELVLDIKSVIHHLKKDRPKVLAVEMLDKAVQKLQPKQ